MADSIRTIAKRLREAGETGIPCSPIRSELPEGDVVKAYAVQAVNTDYWLETGRRRVGAKIGLTSPVVQEQLGVDQPDFGVLFNDMLVGDNETVPMARLMQPKIEAEIAFVLKHDLVGDAISPDDVEAAVDYAVAALEIVDSRIADWDITITDTVADNASSGLFVLGTQKATLADLDLTSCKMALDRNGTEASTGTGAACLGNPLNALLWLARQMASLGMPLQAGDVVMSGALGPMVPAEAGDNFTARIDGLGSVSTAFSAA